MFDCLPVHLKENILSLLYVVVFSPSVCPFRENSHKQQSTSAHSRLNITHGNLVLGQGKEVKIDVQVHIYSL